MSDFRQDPVSGDWIIVAPERAKRPYDLLPRRKRRVPTPVSKCPFEDLRKSGNWPPIVVQLHKDKRDWQAVIIPNKYPALTHKSLCATTVPRGPYEFLEGIGHHDVLITRPHDKNIAHLTLEEGVCAFSLLQKRYRMLALDKCLVYALTFMNWGESAGASLYHPHFQVLSLPIIPPDVGHSLRGSRDYFRKNRRCVHCEMIKYELQAGSRIIFQNKNALAVAPFVSREPFEVRIYPRRHRPYFEKTPKIELEAIVAILQKTLLKIEKSLKDPDFNFFIHTAPLKRQSNYRHYHWHIEVLPKITVNAGFELGTGVEINVVDPDKAAAILRSGERKA
jgi:UDPglucose--hexose-1-phosphate uridylyltransferase